MSGQLRARDLAGDNPRPMTVDEVDFLTNLVRRLDNDHPIVVQIGAGIGVSTLAILEAVDDARIFSVDIDVCPQEFENVARAGYSTPRVIRVLGRSQEIGKAWPDEFKIDFLFVDGDHSADGVRGDIGAWFPLVKRGGIVAFHDYIPEPIPPEIRGRVVYAVDEFAQQPGVKKIGIVDRLIAFEVLP